VSGPVLGPVRLSEAEIDTIAEKAAEKAVEKVMKALYAEVGKNVVKKAIMIIGIATVVLMVWLSGKGIPVIGK